MGMKKKSLIFIFAIFAVFNSCNINASLGLIPASIETDFEPNLKFFANFRVSGASSEQKLEVYATGDLVEYVTFDKTELTGQEGFTAYVDLPERVEKPGRNNLIIRVAEVKEEAGGIGARLEVGGLIVVKVPYPGKYAEIKLFNVDNANSKEPVKFNLDVESLGQEDVYVTSNVKVYSYGNLVDDFFLGEGTIKPRESKSFSKKIEKGYESGFYNATVIVDYGKVLIAEKQFKIGELFVDIINWSSEFKKGKINEFNIEIESKWNSDIHNIYAEVNVTKGEVEVDYFKTPSVNLAKWGRVDLTGFFNAEKLDAGKYDAKIKLFYNWEITEKEVKIKVVLPEGDKKMMIYIILGVVLFLITVVIIYLIFKRKKWKIEVKK